MKKIQLLLISFGMILIPFISHAQGLISSINNPNSEINLQCGSYDLMKSMNNQNDGFLNLSDQLMEELTQLIAVQKKQKSGTQTYTIPIVFHIVYNNNQENIPDSVIFDQVRVLNESFRRRNADTTSLRVEFEDLVGDSKIEFKLAEVDPLGAPSNGITRTNTNIENFGGILPYFPGQNQAISQWVNDSLYINFFRIAKTSAGGRDPWDTEKYLNVWIGDLRIFEPNFNNFEELFFFALATPPMDHVNWPDSVLDQVNAFEQGVLMHYVIAGSNNPNTLPPPYGNFNNLVRSGKILVHEVGHYLGLRHIWGDGDCSADDFIDDTPNSSASSSWDCNKFGNFCVDDINKVDLPNMVENYMDYSSGTCQNSFTLGQIELMQSVLKNYRPLVFDTITSITKNQIPATIPISCYPNPTTGSIFVDLGEYRSNVQVSIQNYLGQVIERKMFKNTKLITLNLDVPAGIYFLNLTSGNERAEAVRFIVE